MTAIQILLIICICVMVTYITMSCIRINGIPVSVSETAYIWESDCNHKGNLHKANYFSLYCLLTAGLLFYPWISESPENIEFLAFLGCAGILGAGSTPFFKEKYEAGIHYASGIAAVACWIIWMCVMGYWIWLGCSFLVIGILCIFKTDAYVFWTEAVGLITLAVKLFLNQ